MRLKIQFSCWTQEQADRLVEALSSESGVDEISDTEDWTGTAEDEPLIHLWVDLGDRSHTSIEEDIRLVNQVWNVARSQNMRIIVQRDGAVLREVDQTIHAVVFDDDKSPDRSTIQAGFLVAGFEFQPLEIENG